MVHGRSGLRGHCVVKRVVIKRKQEQEFVRIKEMADLTVLVMTLKSCRVMTMIIYRAQVNHFMFNSDTLCCNQSLRN